MALGIGVCMRIKSLVQLLLVYTKSRLSVLLGCRNLLIFCLLTLISIFSFLFRFFLLTRNVLPPSADIGQHAMYVNLILRFGFPSWNPYHMVGEQIVRPLGFHYLASLVSVMFHVDSIYAVLYTGLFFSALTPVTIYCSAKRLTGRDSLALLSGGLYCFNILDIEMLSWGGYPNTAGLTLIPLVFYTFLGASKKIKIATALLIPTLSIIDHSSFFFCILILAGYLIFYAVRKSVREAFAFTKPLLVGIAISMPYLVFYGMRIYLYTFITRQMPTTYYTLYHMLVFLTSFVQRTVFFIPFLLLGILYSLYRQQKRFLLFWVSLPFILAVFYFLGIYICYDRLVYFSGQAMMILIALGSYSFYVSTTELWVRFGCKFKVFNVNRRVVGKFVALTIVGLIFALQFQMFSQTSLGITDFYQIVEEDEHEVLKWIIEHTEESDVFVSGHALGWWINGYAQRPCLCYIPLFFINLPWQVQNSENANKTLYLEEGYTDVINKYDVKYVVLRFDQVSGLPPLGPPKNETETVQRFRNNSDFQKAFNPTHEIREVTNGDTHVPYYKHSKGNLTIVGVHVGVPFGDEINIKYFNGTHGWIEEKLHMNEPHGTPLTVSLTLQYWADDIEKVWYRSHIFIFEVENHG